MSKRLQLDGEIIRGRGALGNGHQAAPWPSIAPDPLISMSCRFDPEIKVVPVLVPPGYCPNGSIRRIAPASICRLTLLSSTIGPHKYAFVPNGISTVPPAAPLVVPPAAAATMALEMASVLSVELSNFAP